MRAHRLSMSRMALAHRCLYGFRGDVEAVERPAGRPAQVGSAVHLLAEVAVTGKDRDLSSFAPDVEAEARAIFAGPLTGYLLRPEEWTACEVGMRYDAANDDTEHGPRRGEVGYESVDPMVLPGTLDLVRVEDERIVLRDLKTGKPPQDREQLYAQAVAASRAYGRNVVEVGYVRALKTKCEELDLEILDADRLDEEAGRIARVLRKLPMSEPTPGDDWCWKCNARGACPAFGAAKAEHQMAELEAGGFFG